MDNLTEGTFIDWQLDGMHYPECENQIARMSCICDELRAVEEELGNNMPEEYII